MHALVKYHYKLYLENIDLEDIDANLINVYLFDNVYYAFAFADLHAFVDHF